MNIVLWKIRRFLAILNSEITFDNFRIILIIFFEEIFMSISENRKGFKASLNAGYKAWLVLSFIFLWSYSFYNGFLWLCLSSYTVSNFVPIVFKIS